MLLTSYRVFPPPADLLPMPRYSAHGISAIGE